MKVQSDAVFERDKFQSGQPFWYDEQGQPILFIESTNNQSLNGCAGLMGLVGGVVVALLILFMGLSSLGPNPLVFFVVPLLAVLGFIVSGYTISAVFSEQQQICVYRDDSKRELLLHIYQDHKSGRFNVISAYTVKDQNENVLATFSNNYLGDFFSGRWYCYAPDGTLLCVAKGSIGRDGRFERSNFVILQGSSHTIIGERKSTVFDLSADKTRQLDRRIAVALAVMIETAD